MTNTPLKLLVIDDDEADRLHLKRALKTCGFEYHLTECSDTTQATSILLENSFHCIFLDYLLPGDNGLLLLKKVRERGVKTPIVIITSQGNESIAVELMKAGASDYVVKNNINGQSLGQVIRTTLRMSQVEQEREEAEHALKISEARLAEAQRIAKIGSWEIDNTNQTVHWSPEVFNIMGLSEKNFVPTIQTFLQCVHPEDRDLVNSTWSHALQGKTFNIDFRVTTPEGVKFTNAQGYVPLINNQPAQKMIGMLQDITDRKLAEQEVLKARELAESSMKVKEVFLANMSHEIRTPMNAILGFTRLLYETKLSKEQKSFIDAIHFSGENLLVIIDDILDLSKMGSGKMTMEKSDFELSELVSGIVNILRPKAQEKGLHLTSQIASTIPAFIKGDPVRLNQVLTNLISNAIKFTEKGGVHLSINGSFNDAESLVIEFNVRDSGIGIPEDKRSAIFEDFVQASSDTTRKYGGTGLGLAIVKKIVELHTGKIFVTSTLGVGSTFTVQLPYEKSHRLVKHVTNEVLVTNESLNRLRGASILLVEDNGVNQLLVKKVLGKTGCTVDIASNGVEALERLNSAPYDVILMDVQMPEMDGYEATRHIREKTQPPVSKTPIIAMTAHAFGSDIDKCLAAGMDDYISKPFKAEVLYSKIAKYLIQRDAIIPAAASNEIVSHTADLAPLYELNDGNTGFINELIILYDKQTPVLIEKLRGFVKSHNFQAIGNICLQIKSSYGIVRVNELDKTLLEITALLKAEKPEVAKIAGHVNAIISLISAISEELKRTLWKTA